MTSRPEPHFTSAHILTVMLLIMGVMFVSQSRDMQTAHAWAVLAARYIVFLLVGRGLHEACAVIFRTLSSKRVDAVQLLEEYKHTWVVFSVAAGILVTSRQAVLGEEFLHFFTAYLICQFLNMERKHAPTINYGRGMACSFFEGYLSLVIPSDGAHCDDFVDKIRNLENSQGVVFPVKKLLLVITKSLYCPPDLKHFNKVDRPDLPQIEACRGLEEVKKDVAGTKNRRYRNTAYKIFWPDRSRAPVYITAEFATPLHTLYKVLQKRPLYEELCDVDVPELVEDFCSQLENIISRSPDCRGRCELVYFDDSADSEEYLPSVLLSKMEQLQPDYQDIIARHARDYAPDAKEELLIHSPPKILVPNFNTTS